MDTELKENNETSRQQVPLKPFVRLWHWFLRLISPGYSCCMHCGKPWSYAQHHSTEFKSGRGCFPLCEKCWSEMTTEQRLPYYRRLWIEWGNYGDEGQETWRQMEEAVKNGL